MGLCASRPTGPQARTFPYRHAVITGASAGIGAAVALQLASIPGMHLTLIARNLARLTAVQTACVAQGSHVEVFHLDITNKEALATALQQAHKRRPVDLVIANAGVAASDTRAGTKLTGAAGGGSLSNMLWEAGNTNIMGTLNTLEASLSLLKASAAAGRPAAAAIMSSVSVLPQDAVQLTGQLQMGLLPYAWSKKALLSLSQGLQGELEGSGVAVFTICPGVVLTQLATGLTHQFMGRGVSTALHTAAAASAGGDSVAVGVAGLVREQVSAEVAGSNGIMMIEATGPGMLAKKDPEMSGEVGAVSVTAGPIFVCSVSEDSSEPQTPASSISMAAFGAASSPPASPALQAADRRVGACALPAAKPATVAFSSSVTNSSANVAHPVASPGVAEVTPSRLQADAVRNVTAEDELKKRLNAITPKEAAVYICHGLAAGKGGLIAFPAPAVRAMKVMALLPHKFLVKSIKKGMDKYNNH